MEFDDDYIFEIVFSIYRAIENDYKNGENEAIRIFKTAFNKITEDNEKRTKPI